MLISTAHAQTEPTPPATTAETAVPSANGAPVAPVDTQGILLQNVAMIVLLVIMFYFLLIRPQQKRFKEHKEMVDSLKVGDKVHVNGLVGTVAALLNETEISVDLGGSKVTALRAFVTTPPAEKPADKNAKK